MKTAEVALDELTAQIDVALAQRLSPMLARLEALHPDLSAVAQRVDAFMQRGKRIRPLLLHLGFQAAGGQDAELVMGPALALELLHACALIHDDIIDAAPTRRGMPTVHAAFADAHRTAGWSGHAGHYGTSAAILVGDLAFVQADELFLSAPLAAAVVLDGMRAFTEMREEVMAGQFLDLQGAAAQAADRDQVLTIATMKSGRYSVGRPLQIGAVLAGADNELLEALLRFGDPLGRAFQVRDDLLGMFGHPDTTGKSAASDLGEGKRTLLIVEAYETADDEQRGLLDNSLGNPSLSDQQVNDVRRVLEATGARQRTEHYVATALDQALGALDELPLEPAVHDLFTVMAERLGVRNR